MDWATFAAVLIREGLQVAVMIAQLWSDKTNPTPEQWAALLALGRQSARQQMLLALAQNGIDPASPQGVALLSLTPP